MENKTNIGSIQKIEVAFANFITFSLPDNQNQITVANSQNWISLPFTLLSASFEEPEKQVDEGTLYTPTLSWQQPKISPENHIDAFYFKGKKVIIKITDGNKNVLVLGDPDKPIKFSISRKIPKLTSGYNGYYFSAKMKNTHPAYFVM